MFVGNFWGIVKYWFVLVLECWYIGSLVVFSKMILVFWNLFLSEWKWIFFFIVIGLGNSLSGVGLVSFWFVMGFFFMRKIRFYRKEGRLILSVLLVLVVVILVVMSVLFRGLWKCIWYVFKGWKFLIKICVSGVGLGVLFVVKNRWL